MQIRAQASVLKRAVLDEQNKNSTLRDNVRSKESSLRRAEQEVDSLGFRNKQLEIRVASLQDDLNKDAKKSTKNNKTKAKINNADDAVLHNDTSLFSEDLQKKIFENARLESLVADKVSELQLQTARIEELESCMAKVTAEQAEHDGKLRRELERLATKNHDLEAKLAEASSIVGSDDTLYVSSECEQQQHTPNHVSGDDRLKLLEKEVVYWRTQYEILKIGAKVHEQIGSGNCADVKRIETSGTSDTKGAKSTATADGAKVNGGGDSEEQLLYKHFTQKMEDLFLQKCMAESKLAIYTDEVSRVVLSSSV